MSASAPHVALLTTALDLSGAERVLAQVADGLADRGYRVSVLGLQRRSGALARAIRHPDIHVTDFGTKGIWDVGVVSRLTRWLVKENVTVLYTFLFHAHLVGHWAAGRARVPRRLSSQQYTGWGNRLQRALERWTLQRCDGVVAVSESVRDDLVTRLGIAPDRVYVIPNAIDVQAFRPRRQPFDRNGAGGAIVVGSASRLVPERDHITLLHGFKRALAKEPRLRLRLAGTGPLLEQVRSVVQAEQLQEVVSILGQIEDTQGFHDSLDIYVQPSRSEGLPCAVIEAMAMARPVIATHVAGNRDIVLDGETGWLIPEKSPERWERAIVVALEHPERAIAYGKAGRERAERRFDITTLQRDNADLLARLIRRG